MLDVNSWLIIASISILSIQGAQLRCFKPQWALPVAVVFPVFLALMLSDFIATQSLTAWQSMANSQLQTLQIMVLLEAALACFSQLKILPISTVLAFGFSHLYFLQQGFVDLTFTAQGVVYGAAIAVLLVTNHYLSNHEKYWSHILFAVLLMCTFLTSTSLYTPDNINADFSWAEMLISVMSFAGLVLLGALKQGAQQKLSDFRTNK